VRSTVEVGVVCGSHSQASLVPKVQEEKGVPSVCCMGGCAHAFPQILEIHVTNSELKTMAYNILAYTLC